MHNLRLGVPAAAAIFRATEHLGDMAEFVFLATRNQRFFLALVGKAALGSSMWKVVKLLMVIFLRSLTFIKNMVCF